MNKLIFNSSTLEPMLDWLSERKRTGKGNEKHLRDILDLPDHLKDYYGISYSEKMVYLK